MKENYLEKVYAGIVGKAMGVILGAPVEPTLWTYEKIYETYGDITQYTKKFKNFAADDDLNGPIFFLKALDLMKPGENFEASHVGKAWLNYSREGIGMFWWGGYGTSTEHTAFLNLKNGIEAPRSGSEEVNGLSIAEQIGGQIFIDTWGLIFPGDMEKAAEYAGKAASVSHDKNGIYGAKYIAACIAKAFDTDDILEIITSAFSVIPDDCEYRRVCDAVIDFYNKDDENNFRNCMDFLIKEFGYDRYSGICHIIPNSGVMILSMLYGEGNLARTIEIATMCGWDTDCNAGNVGTILGVVNGYEGLVEKYRAQINDVIIASSSIGSLNSIDVPTLAKEVANYGYQLAGEEIPSEIKEVVENLRDLKFDFNILGSTHGFRTSDVIRYPVRHTVGTGENGTDSLTVLLDRVYRGDIGNIYYKPYYRREDFDDERYQPAFSPKVFSGQKIRCRIKLDKWNGDDFGVAPYIRLSHSKSEIVGQMRMIESNEWIDIEYEIPDSKSEPIDEIGLKLESFTRKKNKVLGNLHISEFKVFGKGYHTIDFKKETREFGTITQFTENAGSFVLEDGHIHVISNENSLALTGNFYSEDIEYNVTLTPKFGSKHFAAFRCQGIKIGYLVGFDGDKVKLIKNDFGYETLQEVEYKTEMSKDYAFSIEAIGGKIKVTINSKEVINFEDKNYLTHGCVGYSMFDTGRLLVKKISFKEL